MDNHILAIGMQRTGKTTFLAALWDVVDAGEVSSSLTLQQLDGDNSHLNEIRALWADRKPIPRTLTTKERITSMTLRDVKSGVIGDVSFPDMDGESFARQWTEREWTKNYQEMVERSTGAILFIHPRQVKKGNLIREAIPLVSLLPEPEDQKETIASSKSGSHEQVDPHKSDGKNESGGLTGNTVLPESVRPASKLVPKKAEFAPTQVQLVELLQFMVGAKPELHGFRLAVVISAWDLVMKPPTTPEKWLSSNLSLLYQYLVANSDSVPFKVFGVSAQGGELKGKSAVSRKNNSPSSAIIVTGGDEKSSDITLPLRWVMNLSTT
jgi:hypothetical protein